MGNIPILNNTDFNYSEIIKGRIENVQSFPSGLSTQHKGYTIYYQNKLWVWDGYYWQSWDGAKWNMEEQAITPERGENDLFDLSSSILGQAGANVHVSIGYSDDIPRTLGTLRSIGGSNISDWRDLHNCRLVLTARNGSWFNIKDFYDGQLPSSQKLIRTFTNTDLYEVVKAEFVYLDQLVGTPSGYWQLVSFERRAKWFKKINISGTNWDGQTPYVGYLPAETNEGLPFKGFYEVSIFLKVAEFLEDGTTPAPTITPQTLEVSGTDGIYHLIDKSARIFIGPGVNVGWYNLSLQGTSLVEITASNCDERKIRYRVNLPNGGYHTIDGGYALIKYLGTMAGALCSI